ncbi:hypothetical protein AHF37_02803 [Paragonimus kellicotti]|nr:hypothetical protein AHF37_02803 [Paragonimus kellicotti]
MQNMEYKESLKCPKPESSSPLIFAVDQLKISSDKQRQDFLTNGAEHWSKQPDDSSSNPQRSPHGPWGNCRAQTKQLFKVVSDRDGGFSLSEFHYKLAYFLIRDAHPPEVLQDYGFKTLILTLLTDKQGRAAEVSDFWVPSAWKMRNQIFRKLCDATSRRLEKLIRRQLNRTCSPIPDHQSSTDTDSTHSNILYQTLAFTVELWNRNTSSPVVHPTVVSQDELYADISFHLPLHGTEEHRLFYCTRKEALNLSQVEHLMRSCQVFTREIQSDQEEQKIGKWNSEHAFLSSTSIHDQPAQNNSDLVRSESTGTSEHDDARPVNRIINFLSHPRLFINAAMILPFLHSLQHQFDSAPPNHNTDSSCACKVFLQTLHEHLSDCYLKDGFVYETLLSATYLDPRLKRNLMYLDLNTVATTLSGLLSSVPTGSKRQAMQPPGEIHIGTHESNFLTERITEEMAQFQKEPPVSLDSNPFDWWRNNQHLYPTLAKTAFQFLNISPVCFNRTPHDDAHSPLSVQSKPIFTSSFSNSNRSQPLVNEVTQLLCDVNICCEPPLSDQNGICSIRQSTIPTEDMPDYCFLWQNWMHTSPR